MKRPATIYFALLLMPLCAGFATARDRMQTAQAAVKQMADETLACAVYFDIVSAALLNSNPLVDLEAQAEQRREEVVQALLALCANAIRNGADPKQVEEFADQELDRMAEIIARRRR